MSMEHDGPDQGFPEPQVDGSSEVAAGPPTLEELLGGDPGPVASTQNLEGVMRRHMRHRRRWTTGIAAFVLAAGTGGGVLAAELVSTSAPAALGGQRPATANSDFGTNGTGANQGTVPGPAPSVNVPASVSAPSGLVWSSGRSTTSSGAAAGDNTTNQGASGAAAATGFVPGTCTQVGCFGPAYGSSHVTRLFDRSSNGIEVRVFKVTYTFSKLSPGASVPPDQATSPPASSGAVSGSEPSGSSTASSGSTSSASTAQPPTAIAMPACSIADELIVEVSDAGAVGEFTVPLPSSPTKPVEVAAEQVLGVEEGSPMAVIVVKAGPSVHAVSAAFASGARDSMVVVGGLAVLVAPDTSTSAGYSGAAASLVATSASGTVVERFGMPGTPSLAEPAICVGISPGVEGGAPGSAGSGAGSSGAATSSGSSR